MCVFYFVSSSLVLLFQSENVFVVLSSWTPAGEGEEQAVERPEPGWILFDAEASFDLDGVHFVLQHSIAQSHLSAEVLLLDEEQVLQVGVEQWTVDHGSSQSALHDEAHGAVVWQADQSRGLLKPGPAGPRSHLLCQSSTEAEPGSSCGEPEPHLPRLVSLQQLVCSDGSVQAGSAHINLCALGEGLEQSQQSSGVHVVIIVHVTKPPLV